MFEVTCGVDGASFEEIGVTDVHHAVSMFNEGFGEEDSFMATFCGGGTQVADICGESSLVFDNGGLEKVREEEEGTLFGRCSYLHGKCGIFRHVSEDTACECTENFFLPANLKSPRRKQRNVSKVTLSENAWVNFHFPSLFLSFHLRFSINCR